MTPSLPVEPREQAARRYVQDLRSFYRLVASAVLVLAVTFGVNALTSPGRWWAVWVLLGFGIAVAFSGLNLLMGRHWFGADWEERKVRQLLDRQPGR